MATQAQQRKASMVRTYLSALRDDPEDQRGRTLQALAREHDIPLKSLRAFREGKDAALAPMVINTWAKLLGTDGSVSGLFSDISPIARDWYQQTLLGADGHRLERYAHYDTIDRTRPEAASALDAWADIVVTGGVGDERRSSFDPQTPQGRNTKLLLSQIATQVNQHLLPDDQKLMLARDLAKYGDQFEQIGVVSESGRHTIARLVSMPVKTMWVKVQPDGSVNPADAFAQLMPGQSQPNASWPVWKMIQFSNRKSRSHYYGTSIFESCLRSYIQIEAMEAAMVIRRLERAPLRMKHVLDVGHLASEQEIIKGKEDYRQRNKKVRTVDGSKNFQMQKINMPADEDYIVAKRDKDSPSDIVPLEGDGNIGQIADFTHFFNKWLSGLGPPKAHLGYEADTMRSVVTDLHIVFARKGRRLQMQFIKGLIHLYWMQLILWGFDPRRIPFTILPPALGTRDELIRAQVQSAHANTILALSKSFAQTGKVPSIRWFLSYMMNLDEQTMKALELEDVILTPRGSGEPNKQEAMEMASVAFSDPQIVADLNRTRFLLNERAIGLHKPEVMGIDVPVLSNPFGHQFDDVVRSLGIQELRVIE